MLSQFQRSVEPLLTKSALEISRFKMSFSMVPEKCDFCETFSAFQALVRLFLNMDADMRRPEILVLQGYHSTIKFIYINFTESLPSLKTSFFS